MTTGNHSLPSPDDSIEIRERIDSGLYGSVYRAVQQPFGRQVAVKIIKSLSQNSSQSEGNPGER